MKPTLTPQREAFDRFVLKDFHKPSAGLIADHWQTWEEAWQAAESAEQKRICSALMAMHERSKQHHNYYACAEVELFGPHREQST